jgi:lipoyl synthase
MNLTNGKEKASRLSEQGDSAREPLPEWFKVRIHSGEQYGRISRMLEHGGLNTVCRGAGCPNIWECWNSGTATLMLLGDSCTRNCTFCGVPACRAPSAPDPEEPRKAARMIEQLELSWAVLTSVTRDDLPDGGASVFAECVKLIHGSLPDCGVEVLIPDFAGSTAALDTVIAGGPQVIAHNVETVPRLYCAARPQADYNRSLKVLEYLSGKSDGNYAVKSSLMVGLGEREDEILRVIRDLARYGCRAMTIGQYLPPSKKHHPVARYYSPEEFDQLAEKAREEGISHIASGPLVRSSYQAHSLAKGL